MQRADHTDSLPLLRTNFSLFLQQHESKSIILAKNHRQTILAIMSRLEEPDDAQSVNKSMLLKVLSR